MDSAGSVQALIGRTVSHYRVLEEIGFGGLGLCTVPATSGWTGNRLRISAQLVNVADSAFGCFDRAYEERSCTLSSIDAIPTIGRLREDPRYTSLLRRMGR